MTTNALQPLMSLLSQTERERDAAAAEAQRAAQAEAAASAQAEQLVAYRSDYEKRWSAQFQREGRMELVNCYRSFMDRLTHAVEHQQRVARDAAHVTAQLREALREQEIRVASVRKLIERRVQELQSTAERIEQKATDEFATRAAWGHQAAALAAIRANH